MVQASATEEKEIEINIMMTLALFNIWIRGAKCLSSLLDCPEWRLDWIDRGESM